MTKIYFVKKGNKKFHPTKHLFAAQLARECMIDNGENSKNLQIIDNTGKIYPNAEIINDMYNF